MSVDSINTFNCCLFFHQRHKCAHSLYEYKAYGFIYLLMYGCPMHAGNGKGVISLHIDIIDIFCYQGGPSTASYCGLYADIF